MTDDDAYAAVADALARLGLTPGAAAYHGLLCGALCVQSAGEVDLLGLVDGETPATGDADAVAVLERLRQATLTALSDMQTGFAPLLPGDEDELGARAQALSEWCEGFLHTLAGRRRLDLRNCSEEVREIVKDFTEFTRAALHQNDDPEVEESAYAELVEYIRVGAQLVFMELRAQRIEPVGGSRRLH